MLHLNEFKVAGFLKSNNPDFIAACAAVPPPWGSNKEGSKGIPATRRQASRWLRKKGIAYKVHKGIA